MIFVLLFFFFSSRRRHTRCALVTGVQTCALPILPVLPPSVRIAVCHPRRGRSTARHKMEKKPLAFPLGATYIGGAARPVLDHHFPGALSILDRKSVV